jgi:predicted DNA-binding transcriptional regulator AlpA
MPDTQPITDRLVRISTLVELLDRSRASLYRDIQRGDFPKPSKLGGSSRWRMSEKTTKIEERPQARS